MLFSFESNQNPINQFKQMKFLDKITYLKTQSGQDVIRSILKHANQKERRDLLNCLVERTKFYIKSIPLLALEEASKGNIAQWYFLMSLFKDVLTPEDFVSPSLYENASVFELADKAYKLGFYEVRETMNRLFDNGIETEDDNRITKRSSLEA